MGRATPEDFIEFDDFIKKQAKTFYDMTTELYRNVEEYWKSICECPNEDKTTCKKLFIGAYARGFDKQINILKELNRRCN